MRKTRKGWKRNKKRREAGKKSIDGGLKVNNLHYVAHSVRLFIFFFSVRKTLATLLSSLLPLIAVCGETEARKWTSTTVFDAGCGFCVEKELEMRESARDTTSSFQVMSCA